jgi:2-succinyl-6-hydroxy-2,4-cyclohexadiene-1-carboxylate synthase
MSLLGLERVGSGPVVVWLHGFTQTKHSGHQFRSILAGSHTLITLDLPGHGDNASIGASLDETADLLAGALPREPFALGGYSLGGRVALHFALRHPERLSSLVLLSTTPGIADEQERRARRLRDEALADRIELIGATAFLDEWLAQPMFSALPADPQERLARSTHAHGLATSLRLAGTGTQKDLAGALRRLTIATTVIAGENDPKFLNEATRLCEAIPHSHRHTVAHAGHAAHLEAPLDVASLVCESAL